MRIILYTVNELRKLGIYEYHGLSPQFYNELAYRSRRRHQGLLAERQSTGSYRVTIGAYILSEFVKEIINDED